MKTLMNLFKSKIAIRVTIVHWILFLVSIYALSRIIPFDHGRGAFEPTWEIFAIPVLISDLPAFLISAILMSPFYFIFEDKTIFWLAMLFTSPFIITFQWLFIGQSIYNIFSKTESKLTSISLTDE